MVDIRTDEVTRTVYATDNSIYQLAPAAVALPDSAEDIGRILADNHNSTEPQPIVARGGGTGTNGQSLTGGLVVEVKRNLNRIRSIDPEARRAVVEPGVVTAKLNAELAAHGLFWAPHTSTLNRATVGGMISTDAAGKGSLIHGRAHRHVTRLDVVLADGTPWVAEPVTVAEAERRAATDDRGGRLWQALLDLPIEQGADFGFPELARGFSGYGLDRLRRDGMIDPLALLCGAEGTLAIITGATLELTPLPTETVLLVASYESFADALDDAVELRASGPSAIETFDEYTLERGRSSVAWPALGSVVGDHRGSVLLLEYSTNRAPGEAAGSTGDGGIDIGTAIDAAKAALHDTGRSRAVKALTDAEDQAAAWKVRADAVGLLAKVATGGLERSARPTAFVEDCAVPVPEMSAFIAGFRSILDAAGVSYGMFGHADVGCVHVRPALDLTDPEQEKQIRSITDSVVDLVAGHGGVLWGEHGRGFRGDSVRRFLAPGTIAVMEQVKAAFDPDDRLNPGKLYRPAGAAEPIVALDDPPLRGMSDRAVPVEVRRHFDSAFACNGNSLCHHYGGTEVMCPSYKATGDPALSPKGRADLLRAWLRRGSGAAASEFEDAIATNLNQCLSCSACSGHCPVEVDIPEMKSRFLERYYETRKRPLSHGVLARFERLATIGARTPWLAGLGAGPAGRLLGLVDLPTPKPYRGHRLPRFEPGRRVSDPDDRPGLVIMPDVFTGHLEAMTLHKTVEILERVGYAVSVAPFVESGKFDHVKGRRSAFARAAGAQAEMVSAIVAAGAEPVVIEPAIALLHTSEYVHANAEHPGAPVRHLAEVLDANRDRLGPGPEPMRLRLLAHCTERATAPGVVDAWQRVLRAVGHGVEVPDLGCCGMAGIFGHERDNQDLSRALWDLTWADPVADDGGVPVATGYSCRSQAERFGSRPVHHPIHML